MATITKPMALDESFNTTESTSRNQADVLAGIEQAIVRGFGRSAADVSYDNTTSGLTADDVQEAIDELADEKVDKVAGKGLSTNDYTDEDKEALDNMELDIAGTQTVSGNPITLTDAAPINAESLVVEFSPKQDLHGYDHPWVGGAGKNKFDIGDVININWNKSGETISNILTETTRNYFDFTILGYNNDTYNGIIYLSQAIETTGKKSFTFNIGQNDNTDKLLLKHNGSAYDIIISYVPMTIKGNMTISFDASGTNPMVAGGLVLSNIQIESGSQATSYAPYSNICPITGYTECEVDDVGKNLFDKTKTVDNKLMGLDGVVNNDSRCYSDYIPIKGNTDYYLSNVLGQNSWNSTIHFDKYKNLIGDKNLNGAQSQSGKITSFPNSAYMIVNMNMSDKDVVQITEGSTAPITYEPFTSTSATIQFGQTVYGGTVDFKTGVLTVDRGYKDLGDLNWAYDSTYKYFRTTDLVLLYGALATFDNPLISDIYRHADNSGQLSDPTIDGIMAIAYHTVEFALNIRDLRYTDATAYKTAVTGNEICYELETPFTIQLTPDELRLLKGTNNLTSNGTTINLGYQPDNVIGEVKGEIEKCAVDAEFMQFTDGTDTFTDVNLSLDASLHTVSVVGSKIEQKRFICFEVMDKMGGVLQGILASCIAFTDGAKTPSGTAFRAYIESLQMYVNFRIYGSGGSYTLAYQSETSFSASAFYVRVRMMNNL